MAGHQRGDRPTLSGEDFARIEAVFESLVGLDRQSRSQAITESLSDRPDLRVELDELLVAHDRLVEAGGDEPALADVAEPGVRVGPYRLVEKIGEGGMGEVYRAERADGLFKQQVAVKITRSTIANSELRRRFVVERQILASLNHDNIVRLLDGGTTEQGQAFVIMEYVEGVSLTRHCRERALPLADRLKLFHAVCRAVQYAHQHGVVHRDLKPANILVTPSHVPKVLDFGVAKLLESQDGTGFTTTNALPGPLTPNYASPEQMRGVAVTTATDVYALGVILYELVTGTRPYETQGLPLERVIETVLHREPLRPSAAKSDAASPMPYALRQLEGDIDAIVLKAMSKEPLDRYASASELAADVLHWLDGDPVLARVPSTAYVLGRLAKRHRRLVAVSALALVAILGASGVAVWQWQTARRAQARAEQRFNEVRQLANTMIFKIDDAVAGLPGSTPVRRMIVDEAIGYLERLGAEAGDNVQLRLEVAGALQQVAGIIGRVGEANLGDREGALKQYERAREMLMPLMAADAPFEVVRAVVDADLRLAELYSAMGRSDVAKKFTNEAIDESKKFLERHPGDRKGEELQARAHFNLAVRTPNAEAIPIWRTTYDFYERLLASIPDDLNAQRNVALVAKYLGDALNVEDRFEESGKFYRRALELDEKRLAARPEDPRVWFDAMISYSGLGSWAEGTGDRETAGRMLNRSLELRRKLAQSDPANMQGVDRLGYLLVRMARFHEDESPELSLKFAQEAVDVLSGPYEKSKIDSMRTTLGRAWFVIGREKTQMKSHAEGCAAFARASRLLEIGDERDIDRPFYVTENAKSLAACAARGQ